MWSVADRYDFPSNFHYDWDMNVISDAVSNWKRICLLFTEITIYFLLFLPDMDMMVSVFTSCPGDWGSIPGRVIPNTQKWYLMLPCLTLSIIRYGSSVKWSNPKKGVAPFPTPWCSSYRRKSLWVTPDCGRQFYWLLLLFFLSTWNFMKTEFVYVHFHSCYEIPLLS